MPNNGITEYTKSILQKRGYVTASEIEAGGRTKPGQVIYQLRKKGMEIRTVKTPTDVEYHLEDEGGGNSRTEAEAGAAQRGQTLGQAQRAHWYTGRFYGTRW